MQTVLSKDQSTISSNSKLSTQGTRQLSFVELEDLAGQLKEIESQIWQAAKTTLEIGDIEYFSYTLQEVYHRYSYEPLGEYLQLLLNQLDAFDWEKIPKTISNFPVLLRFLESQLAN